MDFSLVYRWKGFFLSIFMGFLVLNIDFFLILSFKFDLKSNFRRFFKIFVGLFACRLFLWVFFFNLFRFLDFGRCFYFAFYLDFRRSFSVIRRIFNFCFFLDFLFESRVFLFYLFLAIL
jgi:hypothetical protein